jgi:hypothetical protein
LIVGGVEAWNGERTLAQEKSPRDQAIGVIDEYLTAANTCIKTEKPDGGILGYPAALLLLCSTDAIGHGVLDANGDLTRLDVLAHPLFGPALTVAQANQVKDWYRHLLVHTGTMAAGVHLEPDAQDAPFKFDNEGKSISIRVGKFYQIVSSAWEKVKAGKVKFDPPSPRKPPPDPTARPSDFGSTLSPGASGVPSGAGRGKG